MRSAPIAFLYSQKGVQRKALDFEAYPRRGLEQAVDAGVIGAEKDSGRRSARAGYYNALESSQKATLGITDWLEWFLKTLLFSLEQAMARIDRALAKTRFWQQHRDLSLSAEQIKVLNGLLDGGEKGFEHGINAAQYQAEAKVSKATTTRHLTDLLEKTAWSVCLAEAVVRAIKSKAEATEATRSFAHNPHVC